MDQRLIVFLFYKSFNLFINHTFLLLFERCDCCDFSFSDILSAVRVWNRKNILSILSRCMFDLNKPIDGDRATLLHKAAECGDLEICEGLLKKGVSPNIRNGLGETPLHIVAGRQLKEDNEKKTRNENHMNQLITLMLHYDADINIKDNNNQTAKDTFMEIRDDYLRKLILAHESNTSSKMFT